MNKQRKPMKRGNWLRFGHYRLLKLVMSPQHNRMMRQVTQTTMCYRDAEFTNSWWEVYTERNGERVR